MTGKKPIYSSHLALRFYMNDGWTKEELEECLLRGKIHCPHPLDCWPYWIAEVGSIFDVDKLLEKRSEVVRFPGCSTVSTDKEYLEGFNW